MRTRVTAWAAACVVITLPCMGRSKNPPPASPDVALPPTARARLGVVSGRDAERGHTARVSALAFSPDGKSLATGSWDNSVRLWDAGTGKELQRMPGHKAVIFYVAFSPDGKLLASASRDKSVRLWDVASGREVRRCEGHTADVFGAAFSPDGKTLASAGNDNLVRLWDPATGKERRHCGGLGGQMTTVLFSPDGKTVAAGCSNGAIGLWDVGTGKEVRRFVGHSGWVYPIALSPDGRTLASGSYDGTIRLWEVATGKERRRLADGQRDVFAVAFSRDGRTIASASGAGNMVRLWEVSSGQPRGTLEGHQGMIFRLDFSPDGKTLASGGDDHTALLWDLTRGGRGTAGDPLARVPRALKPKELEGLWADLADAEAGRAYAAVTRLAAAPAQSVPFLAGRLRPPPAREAPPVGRLIAELDSARFKVRERASAELERLGGRVVPDIRRALKDSPSPEVRRRLESLLQKLIIGDRSTDELRVLRAVEVLEHAGTPEARRMLKVLADRDPTSELGEEAKAALGRLARQ